MKISTVEQMRELDRTAVERYGIPDILLMENAGLGVYEAVKREIGVKGRSFALVCGSGNNGGDGFVVARKLLSSGAEVKIIMFGKKESLKESAKVNFEMCGALRVPVDTGRNLTVCEEIIRGSDAVVDGLFGTGLTRKVEGEYAELIGLVNRSGKPVVSIDIPSGIHGDTGEVMGTAVKADITVSFGLPKLGNILYPGFSRCGRLMVSHISFPPEHYNGEQIKTSLNRPIRLPVRDPRGHKGSFGKVLFIAGAASYYGAPLFSSLAFLKAGGGYSRLAAPRSIIPTLAAAGPEVVYHPMEENAGGSIGESNFSALMDIITSGSGGGIDTVVIGPGLSGDGETADLIRKIVEKAEVPVLIDGDGLSAVAGTGRILTGRTAPTILTPHPGEMSRLLDISAADILSKPLHAVREAARMYNAVVVLKGARSCIGIPDGRVWINYTGNSGMGTAGSGDVLSGTVPAFIGLGLTAEEAVRVGVYVHGLSGDLAAEELGEDGITAEDICEFLPHSVRVYRGYSGKEDRDGFIEVI